MDKVDENQQTKEKIRDWVPVILIFGGLGLAKLGIDKFGLVMNTGFLAHGILGLIDSVKKNYHKQFSIKYLKIAGQIMIAVLAIDNLVRPGSFLMLLLLVILDKVILIPSRLETNNSDDLDKDIER